MDYIQSSHISYMIISNTSKPFSRLTHWFNIRIKNMGWRWALQEENSISIKNMYRIYHFFTFLFKDYQKILLLNKPPYTAQKNMNRHMAPMKPILHESCKNYLHTRDNLSNTLLNPTNPFAQGISSLSRVGKAFTPFHKKSKRKQGKIHGNNHNKLHIFNKTYK